MVAVSKNEENWQGCDDLIYVGLETTSVCNLPRNLGSWLMDESPCEGAHGD